MKSFIVCMLVLGACINAEAGAVKNPGLIWGNIPLVQGGNYMEFQDELSKTRAQARRSMTDELMTAVQRAGQTDDVTKLVKALANIIMQFDGLVRYHAQEAHTRIAMSLTDDIKAGIGQLYIKNRLNTSEQRSGIIELKPAIMRRVAAGKIELDAAQYMVDNLVYVAYGSYIVVNGGYVRINLTLENIITSRTTSFQAEGPIHDVGRMIALKVFNQVQGNKYQDVQNPHPGLQWIPGEVTDDPSSASEAIAYCKGQKARVAYAAELVAGSAVGPYRNGGIGKLQEGATYIVADHNRFNHQHYFTAGQEAKQWTGGPVHTAAAHGTITGPYWCVRGQPSDEVQFNQEVYHQMREHDDNETIVVALEYVLTKTGDLDPEPMGHHSVVSSKDPYLSLKKALDYLETQGITLVLP